MHWPRSASADCAEGKGGRVGGWVVGRDGRVEGWCVCVCVCEGVGRVEGVFERWKEGRALSSPGSSSFSDATEKSQKSNATNSLPPRLE